MRVTMADLGNPTEPGTVFCERIGCSVEFDERDISAARHFPAGEFQLVDWGHQNPPGVLSLGYLLLPASKLPPSAPNHR
jgi:hypothetical protein